MTSFVISCSNGSISSFYNCSTVSKSLSVRSFSPEIIELLLLFVPFSLHFSIFFAFRGQLTDRNVLLLLDESVSEIFAQVLFRVKTAMVRALLPPVRVSWIDDLLWESSCLVMIETALVLVCTAQNRGRDSSNLGHVLMWQADWKVGREVFDVLSDHLDHVFDLVLTQPAPMMVFENVGRKQRASKGGDIGIDCGTTPRLTTLDGIPDLSIVEHIVGQSTVNHRDEKEVWDGAEHMEDHMLTRFVVFRRARPKRKTSLGRRESLASTSHPRLYGKSHA